MLFFNYNRRRSNDYVSQYKVKSSKRPRDCDVKISKHIILSYRRVEKIMSVPRDSQDKDFGPDLRSSG